MPTPRSTPHPGRTATTKAMGQGSTQFQHLVQTEVPVKVLNEWLDEWRDYYGVEGPLSVTLRPSRSGSELLELSVRNADNEKVANIVFSTIQDRRGRTFLSVRDQNTFDDELKRKRLQTLMHLFLIYRYKAASIHYLTPTDDNHRQAESLERLGLFRSTSDEIGEIIVADVDSDTIKALVAPGSDERERLISKA